MNNYRGYTKEGECITGSHVHVVGKHYIVWPNTTPLHSLQPVPYVRLIEVLPHTIAQSTGRLDKNKKPIYGSVEIDGEMSKGGDRVKGSHTTEIFHGLNKINEMKQEWTGDVIWLQNSCSFVVQETEIRSSKMLKSHTYEVLGPQFQLDKEKCKKCNGSGFVTISNPMNQNATQIPCDCKEKI